MMGQTASRPRTASKGIVVTLDALGTIYKFKEPVGVQYLKVAQQCGLKAPLQVEDLDKAFRSSYKGFTAKYPNYGKNVLQSPEQWWTQLVDEVFGKVVDKSDIPNGLGISLYRHFTSGEAYVLFSDVRPFLDRMSSIRKQHSGSSDLSLILGVITNSDPRVTNILSSLSIEAGDVRNSKMLQESFKPNPDFRLPWHNAWNPQRDFDFVTTSYDCSSEKPNPRFFKDASSQAMTVLLGKTEQDLDYSRRSKAIMSSLSSVTRLGDAARTISEMLWVHIGDEIVKDVEGARNFGLDALLLDRDGEHEDFEGRVSSLEEAANVVSLIVQHNAI